jgi:protein involved in temperature-dependent protein secretion
VTSPKDSETECFDAAIVLKNEERYEDAIALLEARAKSTPLRAGTRSFLGILYVSVGRTAEAMTILDAVVAEQPTSYRASVGRFLMFSGLNDARRLREESMRWMGVRGEPARGEKGFSLFHLYARLAAINDDEELLRVADESTDDDLL